MSAYDVSTIQIWWVSQNKFDYAEVQEWNFWNDLYTGKL